MGSAASCRADGSQSADLPAKPRPAVACGRGSRVFGSYWSFLLAPVPAMIVGRRLNKHVVLHYHSGEADDHLSRWGAFVHPWLGLAHDMVVPSQYLRTVFAQYGYSARVVPNVVDVSRFQYRARLPLRPRLLSTRNLEPYIASISLFRRSLDSSGRCRTPR